MAFTLSTKFENWITSLRLAWMGIVGKRIFGAFSQIVGDRTVDWANQANAEHLPLYASAQAVALIASERQIDAGPSESVSDLATRLTQAVAQWQRAGTPLGMLLALHYAEFDYATIVTQNGLYFQLTLPLNEDPTTNLVVGDLSNTIAAIEHQPGGVTDVPAGTPWWSFDLDTDWCSRFAIIFGGDLPLPGPFINAARATFDGTEDGSDDHPWPAAVWPRPLDDNEYTVVLGPPVGGAGVAVVGDGSNKTQRQIPIIASGPFVGYVDCLACPVGTNPFANLMAADLARVRSVIGKWKPAKAKCEGVYAIVAGRMQGWPKRTFGDGRKFMAGTIVSYSVP